MNTIIVGLGNPILGDDGIGWKVAEEVKRQLSSSSHHAAQGNGSDETGGYIDVEFLSLGGISLMEYLIGYQRAILIDAISSDRETGSVIVAKLSELSDYSAFHMTSAHDTSLQNALRLGQTMGADLPEDVTVVGIATKHIYDFSEELSPAVAEAVPKAAKIVIGMLT